jgi:probable HAF family extracellular repeat protein
MNLRVAVRFVRPFPKGAHTIAKSSRSILSLASTAGIMTAMLFGGAVSTAFAAASLTPLGGLFGGVFSEANGVSADGSVVVGRSNSASGQEAFRWTAGGGMVGLGDLPGDSFGSVASGVSADGSVVVGRGTSTSGLEAFRWTSGGGMVGLGALPSRGNSGAGRVSADGSVIVGFSFDSGFRGQAFRWTSGGGMVGLGTLPARSGSYANGISADGSVVVGYSSDSVLHDPGGQAFRWTSGGGMVGLGFLPGGSYSAAFDVSADGSVVVGDSGSASGRQAFRWTAGGGMVSLGDLPGGAFWPSARGVSADGSVVVGLTTNPFVGPGAFYWTADGGMRALWDVLLSHGIDPAADGWTKLTTASGISAGGSTIVGSGTRNFNTEAFVAVIPTIVPEPAAAALVLLGVSNILLVRRRSPGLPNKFSLWKKPGAENSPASKPISGHACPAPRLSARRGAQPARILSQTHSQGAVQ